MKFNVFPSAIFITASIAVNAFAATINAVNVPVLETFATAPAITDWQSASMGGNSNAAVSSPLGLASAVNNGLDSTDPDAAPFTASLPNLVALASTTAYGTNGNARYNSTTGAIFTQPTNNYYTGLLATVFNNTGVTLTSLSLAYDLIVTKNATGTESSSNGHVVLFSLTGLAGSWTVIDSLSNIDTSSALSANLTGLNWTNGSNLYVLWADDNAGNIADDTLALDNVSWTAVPEPSSLLLGTLCTLVLFRRRRH